MSNDERILKIAERLNKVNKIIEDFIRPIGNITVCVSTDFYYLPDEDKVAWSFLQGTYNSDEYFDKFFEEELKCPVVNNFIYSLFHEIGHFVTWKNFTVDQQNQDAIHRNLLENNSPSMERDFEYFRLPTEIAASEWAVEYIRNNLDKIGEWMNTTLSPAIGAAFNDCTEEDIIDFVGILEEIEGE